MRILMVTPYSPFPPHSGQRIRTWEEINYLSGNHQVTLATLGYADTDFEVPAELQTLCADVIVIPYRPPTTISPPSLPNLIHAYRSAAMREALLQLSKRVFEVVMLEHIHMAQYADLFGHAAVLEEHNIESNILKRFASLRDTEQGMIAPETYAAKAFDNAWRQWRLMEAYENATWPVFSLRITVSEADKREMDSRCQSGRAIVVENGTNLARMRLLPEVREPNILFMGTFDYYPNLDAVFFFVREILPKIWAHEPAAKLYLAGSNPPEVMMDLATDSRIKVISNPYDMAVVASECRISVVPLRVGGGSRLKILDAMAMGLPVVSTNMGCEGLLVENGIHLAVCDTEDEFAESVLQLCHRDDLYQQLRRDGRQLVETHYGWSTVFASLESKLETVAAMAKRA